MPDAAITPDVAVVADTILVPDMAAEADISAFTMVAAEKTPDVDLTTPVKAAALVASPPLAAGSVPVTFPPRFMRLDEI